MADHMLMRIRPLEGIYRHFANSTRLHSRYCIVLMKNIGGRNKHVTESATMKYSAQPLKTSHTGYNDGTVPRQNAPSVSLHPASFPKDAFFPRKSRPDATYPVTKAANQEKQKHTSRRRLHVTTPQPRGAHNENLLCMEIQPSKRSQETQVSWDRGFRTHRFRTDEIPRNPTNILARSMVRRGRAVAVPVKKASFKLEVRGLYICFLPFRGCPVNGLRLQLGIGSSTAPSGRAIF